MEEMISKAKTDRLDFLEQQAMEILRMAVSEFKHPVFPNAMIVGDCVITHLLHRLDYLKRRKVDIMVVDTLHLFESTMPFLRELETKYGFEAHVFRPEGCETLEDFEKLFGMGLWKTSVDEYDRAAKVEPFQRGLRELEADLMINGRRRDHGADRAYIEVAEVAPLGGGLAKLNPLAYWSFEDCFDYAAQYDVPLHPTVVLGYPSQGDAKDTVPVPDPDGLSGVQGDAGSVRWEKGTWYGDKSIWLDYGSERRGRFVGLSDKDGTKKTECGIHVDGAERSWDRDLWGGVGNPDDFVSAVINLENRDQALEFKTSKNPSVVVVYAPWCPFCQAMEAEFEDFAKLLKDAGYPVAKYRGDVDRPFVKAEFNVKAFPTINVVTSEGLVKYDSEERTVDKFLAFFLENTGVSMDAN